MQKKVTFFDTNDMTGYFLNGDTFAVNVVPAASTTGVRFGSTLVGEIIESQKGSTKIKTKVKPGIELYCIFFLAIVFGLACLYQFIKTGSVSILFWSLAMLIIGPVLSIGLSNVAIASVRERYRMYIDKELKAIN